MDGNKPQFINELNKEIVITHTATLSRLLKKGKVGVDAFTLYNFYCWCASWQLTNQVKATDSFCMKGLHWGRDRFRKAKNLLIKEKIIEVKPYKEKGKILGWYIHIYFLNGFTRSPEIHTVDAPHGEKQPISALNKNISALNKKEISSIEGVLTNSPNGVSVIRDYFVQKCQELKGFKPEIDYAKEGSLIKKRLKKYTIEQLKDLINKYLNSYVGEKFGWSLSVCLSAPVINQWLAGKLEKPKRAYWQGKPMRRRFGKWEVLENGEWLEFAGSEKEIVFK